LASALMLWQAGLGLTLKSTNGPERTGLRRVHFWIMAGIVVLVVAHVLRNGP
jgi:thiosulfate reductase cytochrome b subunit